MLTTERYSTPINPDTVDEMFGRAGADDAPPEQPAPQSNGYRSTFDIAGFIARHLDVKRTIPEAGGTKYQIDCPFDPAHKAPDAFMFVPTNGPLVFKCSHTSCTGKKWQDVRKLFEPGCYDRPVNQTRVADGTTTVVGQPKVVTYQRITSAELASTDYEQAYLVDDQVVAKQPLILAGPKKVLKTSFMIDLAIALVLAGRFLGVFKVFRKCRVAIMSGESGLATLKETALRICKAACCNLADLDGLIWFPVVPRFGDESHLDALSLMILTDQIDVLMIDPAYLAMPSGENGNLFAQGALLLGISELCQKLGVTLVLAHHTRKNVANQYAAPELEDIAWAGFQEFARQWLLLGRRERYEPGTGAHKLWLSSGGSAGHSGLWAVDVAEGTRKSEGGRFWGVTVRKPDEVRNEATTKGEAERERKRTDKGNARRAGQMQELLRRMAGKPEGGTKNDIRAWLNTSGTLAEMVLDDAIEQELVEECEVIKGGRKKPWPGYKLTTKGTEQAAKFAAFKTLVVVTPPPTEEAFS